MGGAGGTGDFFGSSKISGRWVSRAFSKFFAPKSPPIDDLPKISVPPLKISGPSSPYADALMSLLGLTYLPMLTPDQLTFSQCLRFLTKAIFSTFTLYFQF